MSPQQQAELIKHIRTDQQLRDFCEMMRRSKRREDIELAGGALAALIITGLFLWVAFNQ